MTEQVRVNQSNGILLGKTKGNDSIQRMDRVLVDRNLFFYLLCQMVGGINKLTRCRSSSLSSWSDDNSIIKYCLFFPSSMYLTCWIFSGPLGTTLYDDDTGSVESFHRLLRPELVWKMLQTSWLSYSTTTTSVSVLISEVCRMIGPRPCTKLNENVYRW